MSEDLGISPVISKEQSYLVREKSGASQSTKSSFRLDSNKDSNSRKNLDNHLYPETDKSKRFNGTWESETGDGLDGFLAELGLSSKFKRLSNRFTESTISTLKIQQDGDFFSIVDSNVMRDVLQVFAVGTPFESESERGDAIVVDVTWEGDALVYHATPKSEGGKPYIVRRWIEGFHLVQTHCVAGSTTLARREFVRIE